MLSCKKASELISQSVDRRLSWRESLALRAHLWICDACTQFNKSLHQMLLAVHRFRHQVEQDKQLQLSEDAKQRIAEAIASNRK